MESNFFDHREKKKTLRRHRNYIRVLTAGFGIALLIDGIWKLVIKIEIIRIIIDFVLTVVVVPTIFFQLQRKQTPQLYLTSLFVISLTLLLFFGTVFLVLSRFGQYGLLLALFNIFWSIFVSVLSVGIFYSVFRYKRAVQMIESSQQDQSELLAQEKIHPDREAPSLHDSKALNEMFWMGCEIQDPQH